MRWGCELNLPHRSESKEVHAREREKGVNNWVKIDKLFSAENYVIFVYRNISLYKKTNIHTSWSRWEESLCSCFYNTAFTAIVVSFDLLCIHIFEQWLFSSSNLESCDMISMYILRVKLFFPRNFILPQMRIRYTFCLCWKIEL